MKKIIIISVIACMCCAFLFSGCAMEEAIDDIMEGQSALSDYYDDYADSFLTEPSEDTYDWKSEDLETEDWEAEAPALYDDSEESWDLDMPADDLIAGGPVISDGSKLVQTREISMRTTEFDKDYGKVKELLKKVGGYIEYENLYGTAPEGVYDPGRYSSMVMRVPVDKYDSFVEDLSQIGTIDSMEVHTEDYSDSYYDTESRIELLEERKERLLKHLDEATKMEDIITLEDEISDVIYQLDELKGQQRNLDSMVEYATVSLDITEYQLADDAEIKDDFMLDPGNAFNTTLKGMGDFFRVFGVMLAAAAPILILIAVVIVVVLVIVHVVRKANAKKANARTEIK